MKNGDLSAMPTQSNGGDIYGGLTKREMMAMHIMAGLQVNPSVDMGERAMATISVICADALLAELELTKCQS